MLTQQPFQFILDSPKFHISPKPVLKWAGGKGQLIEQISNSLPKEIFSGDLSNYAEPFIGGGALFFHIAQSYPVKNYYISDFNHELILLYRTIQRSVEELIACLMEIQTAYYALNPNEQKDYFYKVRACHNGNRISLSKYSPQWIERSAQIIFLNRTCFNGLYRVNSKGAFNVPFGDYDNPKICDADNLRAASSVLQNTTVESGDFTECEKFVDRKTFVYFDPPYRPISKTASFKAYSKHVFNDAEQIRLAEFYRKLNAKGAKLMLSNSDPKNKNPNDNFFDDLYSGFNVQRVKASRMINSKASKRGPIYELLITNY